MSLPALDDATLDDLYKWLERIPFSKPRKNIARDFSDGVLVAEIIAYFLPTYIDLHNYVTAAASIHKRYNWETLNRKVFPRLNYQMTSNMIQNIIAFKPGAIEFLLMQLRTKIDVAICQQDRSRWIGMRSSSISRDGSLSSLEYSNSTPSDENTTIVGASGVFSSNRCSRYDACPRAATNRSASANKATTNYSRNNLTNYNNISNINGVMNGMMKSSSRTNSTNNLLNSDDYVPVRLLHEAKQTILKNTEIIQVMQARVDHLEKLVELKQERIVQLTRRVEQLTEGAFQQISLRMANSNESKVATEGLLNGGLKE